MVKLSIKSVYSVLPLKAHITGNYNARPKPVSIRFSSIAVWCGRKAKEHFVLILEVGNLRHDVRTNI